MPTESCDEFFAGNKLLGDERAEIRVAHVLDRNAVPFRYEPRMLLCAIFKSVTPGVAAQSRKSSIFFLSDHYKNKSIINELYFQSSFDGTFFMPNPYLMILLIPRNMPYAVIVNGFFRTSQTREISSADGLRKKIKHSPIVLFVSLP